MVQAIKTLMTEKITREWRNRPSIRPYISTSAKGKIIMASVIKKFVKPVGFSKGCAEFMPKKPPPLVPSILMDSRAATGPTTMF